MSYQTVITQTGIPVHFNAKSEPVSSGLRKTLGLKTKKETPAPEKTTITFTVRRESLTERLRRMENGRLTGASVKTRPPEEHQLSPQGNIAGYDDHIDHEPMRFNYDSGETEKGTRYKCSEHHRGRKPMHKHHRNHATAW